MRLRHISGYYERPAFLRKTKRSVRTDARPGGDPNTAAPSLGRLAALAMYSSFQALIFKVIRIIDLTAILSRTTINIRVVESGIF
jgi:hypothetical protein